MWWEKSKGPEKVEQKRGTANENLVEKIGILEEQTFSTDNVWGTLIDGQTKMKSLVASLSGDSL